MTKENKNWVITVFLILSIGALTYLLAVQTSKDFTRNYVEQEIMPKLDRIIYLLENDSTK